MRKFLIKVNGSSYEVEVDEIKEKKNINPAKQIKKSSNVVVAPKVEEAKGEISKDGIELKAPIPGTILKVNINIGDIVKKNQVLLVLEAMKMENELVAPCDGTIKSINAEKGKAVKVGDILLRIV